MSSEDPSRITLPEGWKRWLDWHSAVAPDNATEIQAVEADEGRYIGYIRVIGHRKGGAKLEECCWPDTLKTVVPPQYTKTPLLRVQET